MQHQKSTKRAFGCSVVAVAICVAMLIGTTFAWFTSTASTAVNKIEAGTLAVDIQDENGNSLNEKTLQWQKAAGHENEAVLWEPGAEYKLTPFKVQNCHFRPKRQRKAAAGLNLYLHRGKRRNGRPFGRGSFSCRAVRNRADYPYRQNE